MWNETVLIYRLCKMTLNSKIVTIETKIGKNFKGFIGGSGGFVGQTRGGIDHDYGKNQGL
jgi:hypothetical protein